MKDSRDVQMLQSTDCHYNMPDYTKEKINELVWVCLPATTTLGRAERIACEIYDVLRNEYESQNADSED